MNIVYTERCGLQWYLLEEPSGVMELLYMLI